MCGPGIQHQLTRGTVGDSAKKLRGALRAALGSAGKLARREIVRRCLYDLWIDFGEVKIRAYLGED